MSHVVRTRVLVASLAVTVPSGDLLAQAAERVLYVTALDERSKVPVESLTPADLRVTEDDRAREILRVTPATTPMPVAVVVDNQAAAQATIADLRTALTRFLPEIAAPRPGGARSRPRTAPRSRRTTRRTPRS